MTTLKSVLKWRRSSGLLIAASILLLVVPQFVRPRTYRGPERLGPARIFTGDEPHFLVQIHSFVSDHDLDISNNHRLAEGGGIQTGEAFRGMPLEHHVDYRINGRRVLWPSVFEVGGMPKTNATDVSVVRSLPEFSSHGPYFGIMAGLPLRLLNPPESWIEPLAIAECMLAVLGSLFLVQQLLQHFRTSTQASAFGAAILVFATPILHYSRALYAEAFILMFVLSALVLLLQKRSLGAGCLLGFAVLLKPPVGVLALPFLLRFQKSEIVKAIEFAVPLGISALGVLLANHWQYSDAFFFSQGFPSGNVLRGTIGLLFSWEHGLVLLSPVCLFAPLLWGKFLRNHGRDAAILLGAGLSYFFLIAIWPLWDGGLCFGPRLILPVVPLLMFPVGRYLPALMRVRSVSLAAASLLFFSILINVLSVFPYSRFIGASPWLSKRFWAYTAIALLLCLGARRIANRSKNRRSSVIAH